ncbi:hydroxylysine kinase isoform X2 [Varanus komodoensis]|uniref:hydroxylysine kinase isoform X2 n=1 Tax=Varanus komodoensis TaxID=61221 RepID=UPI001CF78A13|nr:hydroxylysine kinase isoform X2 [Varanus komodoensis]
MSSGSKEQLLNLSKPAFSEKQAIELVERIFGLKVSEIKPLPSYDDENFYVRVSKLEEKGEVAEEFVLKIINCEDSRNPELIEVQTRIMMFLRDEGFPVAAPHFTKDGEIMFLESIDADSAPRAYMKFRHPLVKALHRGEFIWNLANVPLLKRYISAVGQSRRLEVVEQVIQRFSVEIVPKLRSFRPCINHGDLNDHNILLVREAGLVSTSPHYRVSGILDFSDMSHGCYVFEVAITTMYMMIESKDPLHVGGHVLAGFESVVPLTTEERAALFLLVCGRFAQSLVMAAHTTLLHPENEEYLMITAKTGWEHLMMLFETGQEAVEKIWFETAKTYM